MLTYNEVQLIQVISICVILPIMIVWLRTRQKNFETQRYTDIALAAIEKNSSVDVEDFFKKMKPLQKTLKEKLLKRLYMGIMGSLLGLFGLVLSLILYMNGYGHDGPVVVTSSLSMLFLAPGIASLITWFVGMKQLAREQKKEPVENSAEE